MSRGPRGHRGALAQLVLATLLCGCFSSRAFAPDPGPYDRVPEAWMEPLRDARRSFERGELGVALRTLQALTNERPEILPVRVFQQEVELALLVTTGKVGNLSVPDATRARPWLADVYRQYADSNPRTERYVLAARLSENGEEALELLARAADLDEDCTWIHYGRAHWFFHLGRYTKSQEAIRDAFRRDGGHLPTMRLFATVLANEGETPRAIEVLGMWLERTSDYPLVDPRTRAAAVLDLANMYVIDDRPGPALRWLEELDPRAMGDPVRAEEVRAAAHEGLDEFDQALEAIRRARRSAPEELLPLVQEALLLAQIGDAEGERRLLEEIVARTDDLGDDEPELAGLEPEDIDFGALVFRLQAKTRLERINAAEAAQSRP